MSAMWVGIDPGGSETGIIARHGDRCLYRSVVTRDDLQMGDYIAEVISVVVDALAEVDPVDVLEDPVSVEGLTTPNPHIGMTSVRGLLDTAQVLGAVLAHWPTAVVVPPAGNGSAPLAAYPADLRPIRGQGKGRDRLRHCRSAWDIAGAAPTLARLQQQGALAP